MFRPSALGKQRLASAAQMHTTLLRERAKRHSPQQKTALIPRAVFDLVPKSLSFEELEIPLLFLLLQQSISPVITTIQNIYQIRIAISKGKEVVTQQIDLN